ncbi:hypothetical protein BC829DRAFT_424134 [Chytridium lagenaria]|nr:hypothetical protein BC829DRAFT_424134 [Chytridium lagenaria]
MSTNTLEGGCFFGTGTNTYKAALVSKLNLHVNLANHRQTPTTEGLTTWRTIPHAAVLNKNYRCSTDYALFLSNFRNGFVSQIHLDKLNSRCLRHHPTILSEAEWQQAPFIIPYNAIRINFNVQSVEARASVETPVHWIIAEDRAGNLSPATIAKLQYQNRDLSDTETSDLPTLLPLQEGHEYIVTNNLGPELNISKSTKCTLVRISYPSGYHPPTGPTLLVKRKINLVGTKHVYPDRLPEWLEVRLHSPAHNLPARWPGSTDDRNETISLIPLHRSIRMSYNDTQGKAHSVSATRRQFCLVPADAFTIYRCQGQSMDKVLTTLTMAKSNDFPSMRSTQFFQEQEASSR